MATQIERPELDRGGDLEPPAIVPALARLLSDLRDEQVRFCSWKSNEHLGAGLAGSTDLDLLVDERDLIGFRRVLARHGVKPLAPAPARVYPGMEHHLGLDRDLGRLYHLHVHTRLVLGEQHVKNHRIAVEREFLEPAGEIDGMPVPAPELELGVLAIRALLKYRARDVVKDALSIRSSGLKPGVRAELEWLLARTSVADVRARLQVCADRIPTETACAFLETYQRDPRAGVAFWRLRARVRRELAGARRAGRGRARAHGLAARWRMRRRPMDARMRPSAGGLTVAFVGSDGSGKSTVTAELARWLGWKLAVRTEYLGSKSPSLPSRATYRGFRVLRRVTRAVEGRFGAGARPARASGWMRDVALATHDLTLARERAGRCRDGRRSAGEGAVVLFDRFPMQALSDAPEHRVLDGPRIARTLPADRGTIRRLARREEAMYQGLGVPDVLVFLHVDPAEAARRKPDHAPEVLDAKTRAAAELADLAGRSTEPRRVIDVDAGAPLDDVLRTLKSELWDVL